MWSIIPIVCGVHLLDINEFKIFNKVEHLAKRSFLAKVCFDIAKIPVLQGSRFLIITLILCLGFYTYAIKN